MKHKTWQTQPLQRTLSFPTQIIKNQILKCLKAHTQLLQISKRWVISRCSFQNRMDKIWSVACDTLALWSQKRQPSISTLQQKSHPFMHKTILKPYPNSMNICVPGINKNFGRGEFQKWTAMAEGFPFALIHSLFFLGNCSSQQ